MDESQLLGVTDGVGGRILERQVHGHPPDSSRTVKTCRRLAQRACRKAPSLLSLNQLQRGAGFLIGVRPRSRGMNNLQLVGETTTRDTAAGDLAALACV